MKNEKIAKITGIAATLLSLGIIGATTIGTVSAATTATTAVNTLTNGAQTTNQGRGPRGMGAGMGMGMFDKNVTRTVTNISNGIQISMTSTDAATVTKLQAMKQPANAPADAKITVTQTNISNGVQLTVTSTDAATVTKLQTDGKDGKGFGFGGPGMGGDHGRRGPGMGGMDMMFDKNVTHTVTNLSNGVQITLTSTDAATVTKLQDFAKQQAAHEQAEQNGSTAPATSATAQ